MSERLTVRDAILAHLNQRATRDATFRALLAHPTWWVPRPVGQVLPTIVVTDLDEPPTIWAFSCEEGYLAAAAKHHAAAIGHVSVIPWLDDVLAPEDPRVARLVIDPSSPIAFAIQTDALAAFRRLARAVRVERAMAARDLAAIRAYDAYLVPYFGELGRGHNLVTIPSERGAMLAAFTAHDQIEAFLAAGSDDDRARVRFVKVDGNQLFGAVEKVAQGVMVNATGDQPFGFELAACREIAKC